EAPHAPGGKSDPGERMRGADDLHGLARPLRPLDRLDDLELARRLLDGGGGALLVAAPVAPASTVAHRAQPTFSAPPQLAEAGVVDAEMGSDLVNHGDADLVRELRFVPPPVAQLPPEAGER